MKPVLGVEVIIKDLVYGSLVLYGEHLEKAAKRVVREETGKDVKITKILRYSEYDKPEWRVNIVFEAELL
jgi:ADP-ribose pyrophosphatase YjhB (NUDIX family)